MNNTLTLAIVGHLVGDYLLQTDWMAKNKKRDSFPCLVHCYLWTISVMFFSGWTNLIEWNRLLAVTVFWILFLTHFIQDRTQIIVWWMRLKWKDQSEFTKYPMAPWSLVVVDNVWHIVTIWLVWRFVI